MDSAEKREPELHLRVQSDGPADDSAGAAEDGELIQRAQAGNADAFSELVQRHQDRLYNMLYRMSHNHADAADWTQAAFLKAWQALDRFDGRAGFYTWLYRIATNLAITEFRTRRRRGTSTTDFPAGGEPASEHAGPAERVELREMHDRAARALAELPDEYRAAVVLKDVEGLDYATIAEILEVPVGTVRSRIHRGRTLLQQTLHDKDLPA